MSVTPFPTAMPERASLGASIQILAMNVTGYQPDTEASWRAHVAGLLRPLRDAFAAHRAATEGANGLYAGVVHDAPRLAGRVDNLVEDHASLDGAIQRLAGIAEADGDADALRRQALAMLDDLARHRQLDSDLVYDAYTTDIGGE